MRDRIYLNGKWNFMPDYKGIEADEIIKNIKWEDEAYIAQSKSYYPHKQTI